MDNLISLIRENIVLFDIIFLIFIIYFAIQCFAKGFFLSLVSFLKWVLALIITIILVPKLEPYVSDYVENEYVSGIGLGITIYVLSLFLLILLGKSLGRLFSYTGLGSADKIFGFFFGIFKGYVFFVCIFSIVNWFYSYEKWDMSLKNSYFFSITKKGSRLLIEEFPEKKDLENTKKEIEKI
tara:strand:- start:1707 stop:2252 length:546 start_codon:yes stop_codon:yes gene_type:complete